MCNEFNSFDDVTMAVQLDYISGAIRVAFFLFEN